MIAKVAMLLLALVGAEQTYHILTMDGGGIKGIITTNCIKKMELYAYHYAEQKGYLDRIPKYTEIIDKTRKESNGYRPGRIHMQDLFEMFAGTSTGSILASSLSLAYTLENDRQPMFWAEAIEKVYIDNASNIFKQNRLS
jgi:patatin-like phospholipase/acyl hydrolase